VKPLTYMNLSGQVLRPYLRRPAWSAASDLMVLVDEVAIPIGTYRVRARGSAGGHNGLKDVERALGSQEYARLRIGIGPTDERRRGDLSSFVLSRFGSDERSVVLDLMPRLQDAVEIWLRDGILKAMNAHNANAKST
jgi:PTH1 family peptidyl-tRNA hydrolase